MKAVNLKRYNKDSFEKCLAIQINNYDFSLHLSFSIVIPVIFIFSLLFLFLVELAKVISIFFSNCGFNHVWPGPSLIMYAVYFQAMPFRDKQEQRIKAAASEIFLFGR